MDDAPGNRLLLGHLLRKRRCVVLEATNGQEAIEIALREQPDLILMDLMMPVLDGWEAVRRIRAVEGALRAVPIFAVTAALQKDAEQALAAGCNQVLAKPIRPRALWALIQQTLPHQKTVCAEQSLFLP